MEAELKRLVRHQGARAVHLRRDDASLEHALERMRRAEETAHRIGHIAAAGIGLRAVKRD